MNEKKLNWVIVLLALSIGMQGISIIATNAKISFFNSHAAVLGENPPLNNPGSIDISNSEDGTKSSLAYKQPTVGDQAPTLVSITPNQASVGDSMVLKFTALPLDKNDIYFCYQGDASCLGAHSGYIPGLSEAVNGLRLTIPAILPAKAIPTISNNTTINAKYAQGGTIIPGVYNIYVKNTLGTTNSLKLTIVTPPVTFTQSMTLGYGDLISSTAPNVISTQDHLLNVFFDSVTKDTRCQSGLGLPCDSQSEAVVRLKLTHIIGIACTGGLGVPCTNPGPPETPTYIELHSGSSTPVTSLGYHFLLNSVSAKPTTGNGYTATITVAK